MLLRFIFSQKKEKKTTTMSHVESDVAKWSETKWNWRPQGSLFNFQIHSITCNISFPVPVLVVVMVMVLVVVGQLKMYRHSEQMSSFARPTGSIYCRKHWSIYHRTLPINSPPQRLVFTSCRLFTRIKKTANINYKKRRCNICFVSIKRIRFSCFPRSKSY